MNQPFYEAANAVIKMYLWRQERSSAECPAHSPCEVNWAADRLLDVAMVAAYVGSVEAVRIRELAEFWRKNKHLGTPRFIPIDNVEITA